MKQQGDINEMLMEYWCDMNGVLMVYSWDINDIVARVMAKRRLWLAHHHDMDYFQWIIDKW